MITQFFLQEFSDLQELTIQPQLYSELKYGSDAAAHKLGEQLAISFFNKYSALLLVNQCVVYPSPYNQIQNAASITTIHFIRVLNTLLVNAQGEHVDVDFIRRKASYFQDYGFLHKDVREQLLNNDQFYVNKRYIKNKLLIFVDDVIITGTHERKVIELLDQNKLHNDVMFLYLLKYTGDDATIEGRLNTVGIDTQKIIHLLKNTYNHLIIRPIKYLLSLPNNQFKDIIEHQLPYYRSEQLYYACLEEGYYKVPIYQSNFNTLTQKFNNMLTMYKQQTNR
jgi:hypothetical protein